MDAAERPRVLVAPREGGWGAPEWEVDEASAHSPDLGRILGQVRERLGLEVGIPRYVEAHEDEATRRRSGTWVMELRAELSEALRGKLHHAQSYLQILRSLEPADYWQWVGELGERLTPVADPTRKMRDTYSD